jgi:hypothetical protein
MAQMTMSFDAWKEGRVAPATVSIRVIDKEPRKKASLP